MLFCDQSIDNNFEHGWKNDWTSLVQASKKSEARASLFALLFWQDDLRAHSTDALYVHEHGPMSNLVELQPRPKRIELGLQALDWLSLAMPLLQYFLHTGYQHVCGQHPAPLRLATSEDQQRVLIVQQYCLNLPRRQ